LAQAPRRPGNTVAASVRLGRVALDEGAARPGRSPVEGACAEFHCVLKEAASLATRRCIGARSAPGAPAPFSISATRRRISAMISAKRRLADESPPAFSFRC